MKLLLGAERNQFHWNCSPTKVLLVYGVRLYIFYQYDFAKTLNY